MENKPLYTKEELEEFYLRNKLLLDAITIHFDICYESPLTSSDPKKFIWSDKAKGNVGDIKID